MAEIKTNLPLIGRISSIISKLVPPPKKREETTETSTYAGVVSYYYQKTKLERTRLAKYGDYEEMDETYPEISSCLSGDTLVQTIEGPVKIKDLCSQESVLVFSYDHENKRIVIANASGAKKTRINEDVWNVYIDDGRIIRATKDHLFMLRDGSYKKVEDLKPYDSLMPFYIRVGSTGYKEVFQPNEDYTKKKRWEFVYRLSAQYKYGEEADGLEIHHSDFNKLNDLPDNLVIVDKREHGRRHFVNAREVYGGKLPRHIWTEEERERARIRMIGNSLAKGNVMPIELRKKWSVMRKGVPKTSEWREALARANKRRRIDLDITIMCEILSNGGTVSDIARYFNVSYSTAKRRKVEAFGHPLRLVSCGRRKVQRMAANHCVVKVEYAGKEDVYDLFVPIYHNFAVEGVFVHNSLDLYADNATKERGQTGEVIEIKTDDTRVKNVLDELIARLRLNDTLWDTARNMAKMGDDFDEVVCDESGDVIRLKNLPPNTIYVNVDEYGRKKDKPYVQKDETGSTDVAEFEDWQIIHWKNGGMKRMYGESVMKSIRRVYKQLQMMEDGMVIARLTRSHMRYKILVDVEGMTAEEREDYLKRIKNEFKKKRLINPLTGQLDTTQNPLSAEEDFFLAVTKDSRADVDVLQGATNLGNIRDVEYFQTKLFAGLKVPKAFVGLEKEVKAKATIVEEDIQFARTVGRIRKGLRIGLKKLFDYQLMVRGIAPINGLYEIHFAPISMVDEMRKWTIEKIKAEVAKIYRIDMGLLTDEFILKHFVGLDDEDIEDLKGEKTSAGATATGSGRRSRVTSVRSAELSGLVTPKFSGMSTKVEGGNGLDRDNLHIATLHMMNLVETLRDLVDLELNR